MNYNQTVFITSATRQVRQRWFLVCIFPLSLEKTGLSGDRPESGTESGLSSVMRHFKCDTKQSNIKQLWTTLRQLVFFQWRKSE